MPCRKRGSLKRKEFKSDVFDPCMETVAEVESSFMGAGLPVKPFLKTLSNAIKQKLEDEAECGGGLLATNTPDPAEPEEVRVSPRLAASPDTTPTVLPRHGWDCGTRSGTRPGKTGFLSHCLLTEQHTCPRVSHEKNLRRFSVQGEARGEVKKKKGRERRDGRKNNLDQHGKCGAVFLGGGGVG